MEGRMSWAGAGLPRDADEHGARRGGGFRQGIKDMEL
jgi:hypothetical protein